MTSATPWTLDGVVISCQAPEGSPLRDSHIMAVMAVAAQQAGASGIRAEGAADIAAIRAATTLPIIGIRKHRYPDSDVYITATTQDVDLVADAGAPIVALDATARPRPGGQDLADVIARAHRRGLIVMADLASPDEAPGAIAAGADVLATTLVPASDEDRRPGGPNIAAIAAIARAYPEVTIVAEGRYATAEDVRAALEAGARTVVVGRAVTDTYALARDVIQAAENSPGPEETPRPVPPQ